METLILIGIVLVAAFFILVGAVIVWPLTILFAIIGGFAGGGMGAFIGALIGGVIGALVGLFASIFNRP